MLATLLAAALTALGGGIEVREPDTTTFVETFESGGNEGGWSFGNAFESIQPDGARHGLVLRNVLLDTFAPRARTTSGPGSVFTGDYRARGVTSVGIDLRIYRVDFTSRDRPVTVILESDAGTPDDASDDCGVYLLGVRSLPPSGRAWARYDFAVPSPSQALPDSWRVLGGCAGRPPDEAWSLVISDVDRLSFFGGDPELFFIFQVWDIALDNPRVTFARQ